jgi:hypothetical protein
MPKVPRWSIATVTESGHIWKSECRRDFVFAVQMRFELKIYSRGWI